MLITAHLNDANQLVYNYSRYFFIHVKERERRVISYLRDSFTHTSSEVDMWAYLYVKARA